MSLKTTKKQKNVKSRVQSLEFYITGVKKNDTETNFYDD